jgi:hypothetical protein
MATFDANTLMDPLSGVEIRKVQEWIEENGWWVGKEKEPLTPHEEVFFMALSRIGENRHRLTAEQELHIIELAKSL